MLYNENEVIILKGEIMTRGNNKMEIAIPLKYNVRDTKKYYSDINNYALKGLEVITYKGINKTKKETDEVSHIKKGCLDYLLNKVTFNPVIASGEEFGGYTVSINEIDMYGEGKTVEEATNNLLDSILEYIDIYIEQIDLFSKVENAEKQIYMLKLIRCNKDKDALRKVLGL